MIPGAACALVVTARRRRRSPKQRPLTSWPPSPAPEQERTAASGASWRSIGTSSSPVAKGRLALTASDARVVAVPCSPARDAGRTVPASAVERPRMLERGQVHHGAPSDAARARGAVRGCSSRARHCALGPLTADALRRHAEFRENDLLVGAVETALPWLTKRST